MVQFFFTGHSGLQLHFVSSSLFVFEVSRIGQLLKVNAQIRYLCDFGNVKKLFFFAFKERENCHFIEVNARQRLLFYFQREFEKRHFKNSTAAKVPECADGNAADSYFKINELIMRWPVGVHWSIVNCCILIHRL